MNVKINLNAINNPDWRSSWAVLVNRGREKTKKEYNSFSALQLTISTGAVREACSHNGGREKTKEEYYWFAILVWCAHI